MLACFGEASGMSVIRTKWVRCEGGRVISKHLKTGLLNLRCPPGYFFCSAQALNQH